MGSARALPCRQQPRQPRPLEASPCLVEGGPREAEGRGGPGDRMTVDAHATQHLVLDLDGVAGVEELVLKEELVGHPLRVRVERATLLELLVLGIGALGPGHEPPWREPVE